MRKKYKFDDNEVSFGGHVLHRIIATRNFHTEYKDVKVGDFGGWIESEDCLSQDGNCWVFLDSYVYDGAKVCEDAWVAECAHIVKGTILSGQAYVKGKSMIEKSNLSGSVYFDGDYNVNINPDIDFNVKPSKPIDPSDWKHFALGHDLNIGGIKREFLRVINDSNYVVEYTKGFVCGIQDSTQTMFNELKSLTQKALCDTEENSYNSNKSITTNKKYKFTGKTIEFNGHVLYQIQSLINLHNHFIDVDEGDLGGWIESEDNLSQDGTCWVLPGSYIMDKSVIKRNAYISDGVVVTGKSVLSGDARVSGQILVSDSTINYLNMLKGSFEIHD